MRATTAMPPSASKLLPGKASSDVSVVLTQPQAKTGPTEVARLYWGDWVALVFWLACFVLMGVILLSDLIVSLFR